MGNCRSIKRNEQLVVNTFTDRKLVNGPVCFYPYNLLYSTAVVRNIELKQNQYILITNSRDPSKNRHVFGACLATIEDPYETFDPNKIFSCPVLKYNNYIEVTSLNGEKSIHYGPLVYQPQYGDTISPVLDCCILDQDDYIIVTEINGVKKTVQGPGMYQPKVGDIVSSKMNALVVERDHYITIQDSNDSKNPIKRIRGPYKFIPEPYQTVVDNKIYKCIPITETEAIHTKLPDGNVLLIDTPSWYMPSVGEQVMRSIQKIIMLESQFCILKAPNGHTHIMDGEKQENRSFFLKPFYEFIEFDGENGKKISVLSKLPTFISHNFIIRTNDNVLLKLDLRITYQIQNTQVFGSNPIPFYAHLKSWCQDELLDMFAKVTLKDFMQKYSSIVIKGIENGTKYFSPFGIHVLDIQILNYGCTDDHTQKLLDEDIKTYVVKQNEIRAQEFDVEIRKRKNEILKHQKDLEVELFTKDKEIEKAKKGLEIDLRLKELELQIKEEEKKQDLLEIKRQNAVTEAKYEGLAQGESVAQFISCLVKDAGLTREQALSMWNALRELEKSHMIYQKVGTMNMYPPNSDLKFFVLDKDIKQENIGQIVAPDILSYSLDKKNKK